jgi:hypothetical protein
MSSFTSLSVQRCPWHHSRSLKSLRHLLVAELLENVFERRLLNGERVDGVFVVVGEVEKLSKDF